MIQFHDDRTKLFFAKTALQVYARTYKQAPVSQTHSLLRKAQRLDQILHEARASDGSRSGSKSDSATPEAEEDEHVMSCRECRTTWSPRFYYLNEKILCHRCYFDVEIVEQKKPNAGHLGGWTSVIIL